MIGVVHAPRAALLALAALTLGAGCDDARRGPGGSRSSVGRRDPGTLIVGRAADAISLDPARVTDLESVEVVAQVHETLVTYRPDANALEPALAERWTISDDGTEWTFHLRRGVRFHDGSPLDAAAVVFSFERMREGAAAPRDARGLGFAYARSLFQRIRSVVAIDRMTVRFTCDGRYAPLAANLAVFAASIVSPRSFARGGAAGGRRPVGTGPFRFVSWDRDLIVLERNPDYWGGPPEIDRLVFRSIPSGRQRLIALESGSIDVAYSILPDELQFVALHPDLVLLRAPSASIAYLAMNTQRPPFDDVRVRRAANLAINKEPIVKLAYQGLATAASGPLPPTVWSARTEPDPRSGRYDPAAARALLAEATRAGRFDPTRVYRLYLPATPRPYLPSPEEVGRVIAANLAAVGISTELVVQDLPAHLASAERGDHDLCLLGWVGDTGDPDNYLYVLLHGEHTQPGAAKNVAFLRDPPLDALLLAAQRSALPGEREALYRAAQERVADRAPWVPLANAQVAIAARVDVAGLVVVPSTYVDFKRVRRLGR